MSAEQTPDIDAVREALSSVLRAECRLGTSGRWFIDAPLVEFAIALENALAPVLAAAVRDAKEAAWDEGERHESEYLATWGQFCPGRECNPYRADRVAEPQHEAATSSPYAGPLGAIQEGRVKPGLPPRRPTEAATSGKESEEG